MTIAVIIGYFFALIVGLTLGLTGAGGSILTVPVLVYLMGTDPVLATGYSLFVVGVSASVGLVQYIRLKLVMFPTALAFGLPSSLSVLFSRQVIVTSIPQEVKYLGLSMPKGAMLMGLFALLMAVSSWAMLRGKKEEEELLEDEGHLRKPNYPFLVGQGAATGLITGLLGAGGGFIIVPALVMLAKLPVKQAVGTSLFIVMLSSLLGFASDALTHEVPWTMLGVFTSLSVVGIVLGSKLAPNVPADKLKRAFGIMVLVMGAFILVKEFVLR